MKRLLCLLAALLLLVSCSPAQDPSQIAGLASSTSAAPENGAVLQYTAIYGATPAAISPSSFAAPGNGRFWQTAARFEDGKSVLFIASVAADGGYFERHPYAFEENRSAAAIAAVPGETGALWFVEQSWDPDLHTYADNRLRRTDAEGRVTAEAALRDDWFDSMGTFGAADGDGNYYLYSAGSVYSFDTDASLRFSAKCPGFSGFARASDGSMVILSSFDGKTELLRPDAQGRLEPLLSCTFSGIADGDGQYDLYGYDRVLYGIRLDTGELTPLFRFAELDLTQSSIVAVQPMGTCADGSPKFGCYAIDGGRVLLCRAEKTVRAPRKTLTLGVLHLDQSIEQAVVDFNRASTDVRIEIVEYASADDSSGITGLNLALASGQTPDLLDLYGARTETYVRQGVLADLYEWMDDTVDILPFLVPMLETDGGLYALPRGFGIRTLFSTDALAGDGTWTFADMLDALDRHPEVTQPLARMTAETGSHLLQDAAVAGCIDGDAGSCDFTRPGFLNYLSLLRRFPERIPDDGTNSLTLLQEGRALCQYAPFVTVGQFMDMRCTFGDRLRTPGMPETGNTVDFGHALSITTACSDTDAAWAFLKSYLSGLTYSLYGSRNIPILADAYDAYLAESASYYARAKANNVRRNGEPIYVPDDADWAAWDALIGSLTQEDPASGSAYSGVDTIVSEEVSAFLGGARSAEETARVIDSRVRILLAEGS